MNIKLSLNEPLVQSVCVCVSVLLFLFGIIRSLCERLSEFAFQTILELRGHQRLLLLSMNDAFDSWFVCPIRFDYFLFFVLLHTCNTTD